ncbi:MAG: FAD-dependent oxidoreductase [Rickettsia sp.]|nr:FAD-dependent oxidoreductase [Rickettsia sp.]
MKSELEFSEKTATVVGGGIMGVSTAWALVKNGIKHVTLIDMCELPRKIGGASVDGGRLIHYHHSVGEGYTLMAKDAYATWEDLFNDLECSYMTPTGLLLISSTPNNEYKEWQNYMKTSALLNSHKTVNKHFDKLGIKSEYLTPNDIKSKFPYLKMDEIEYAIFAEKGCNVLHAADIINATVKWLKKQSNATVLEGSEYKVTSIKIKNAQHYSLTEPENDYHTCALENGNNITSDLLVLAAGIYTDQLIPEIYKEASIIHARDQLTYYKFRDHAMNLWKDFPNFIDATETVNIFCRPCVGGTGTHGVKITMDLDQHHDYKSDDFVPTIGYNQPTVDWLNKRFAPDVIEDLKIAFEKVCYHDITPDHKYVFKVLDNNDSAIALYGFSAHGFKFGSLVGKSTCAVLKKEKSAYSIEKYLKGDSLKFFDNLD